MLELNKENYNKLNLGCGRDIMQGWVNLDVTRLPGVDVIADLDDCANTPLSIEDNLIDEFLANHLIEHLKNPLPFMQELHRIAKPDAMATFRVPYGSSDDAFEDPTHIRRYFLNSFQYFSQPFYWRADYKYRGDWLTERIHLIVDEKQHRGKSPHQILSEINLYRNIVSEMTVELRAIKPIREPKKELQNRPSINIILGRAEV